MRARTGLILAVVLVVALGACTKKNKTEEKPAESRLGEVALPATGELPREVVYYLLVANPTNLLGELEKLGGQVSPVPPGTLHAMVTGQLIQAGLKDTAALNLNAPAGLMILDPKRFPQPLVVACQVQGEDQVLKALQPAWKHKSSAQGIHELVQEEVDTYGVFKGDSAEPRKISRSLFVRFSGRTMLLAPDQKALELAGPLLEQSLKKSAPKKGLVGAVLVNHLRQAFQAELQAAPELLSQAIKPELARSGFQDAEKMAWLMDWVLKKMLALVQQTRELTFSAAFSEEGAIGTLGIAPEADSFFMKFLAEQKHARLTLTNALPPDQFLAVAFNLQWHAFKDELVDFTREVIKVFFSKDLPEDFLAAIVEMWDVMGDEIALTENLDADGLSIVELFSVSDENRARAAIAKVLQMTTQLMAEGENFMGMKFKFSGPSDLGVHDGVKLQSLTMDWDMTSLPTEQLQLVKRFYGDKLTMVMAIFDGKFAFTMGRKAKPEMQALIDRARKKQGGLTDSEAFRHASGELLEDSGGFFYLSIARMVISSLESTYAIMGQKPPEISLPSPGSGVFTSFRSTPELVTMTLRIPGRHLTEIGKVIQALMQASAGQGR